MRVGTRGSALAMAQALWVAARLEGSPDREEVELVRIVTTGDRGEQPSDKSRWVSELERALLEGRVEIAIHSAKDVPAELADGLVLAAIPSREDPRDVLCGAESLQGLADGARVGTSSLRRAAQLRAVRPDLEVVELRGNVDTRIRKLADGEVDALILARAGLRRLGREAEAGGVLDEFVPAAGQGALAVEAVAGSSAAVAASALNDPESAACVGAERDFTRLLGASCHTSVGALARQLDGGAIELTGWVGLPDGSEWIADRLVGDPGLVGGQVAERMISAGADELLGRAARDAA